MAGAGVTVGTALVGFLKWIVKGDRDRADRWEALFIKMLPEVTSVMDQSVSAIKEATSVIHNATFERRGDQR